MMNMDFQDAMEVLNNPNGLKKMMKKSAFENEGGEEFSQADLVSDVINILRMDTKQIGAAVGVEISISRMTPDRAAELLQGVARGDAEEFIDVFEEIENKRMRVLVEAEDEESVREYLAMKQSMLHVVPDGAPVAIPPFMAEDEPDESGEDEDQTDED